MAGISLRGLFAAVAAAGGEPGVTRREWPRGERVSVLGYGAMRIPEGPLGYDQAALDAQVKYLLEHGVNYFDTAPVYCRGESERRLGRALARSGFARADYRIATKLSNFAAAQRSAEASRKLFEGSLRELGTDYVDYYLLHAVGNDGFETFRSRFVENGMIDWLVEQRRLGRIRNLGWSFHGDPKAVEWLLARHDEGKYVWDFAMIQMNYVDWRHAKEVNGRNLDAEYLYGELARRGIRVAVMEPLLGGRLARFNAALASALTPLDPEATQASWALRFCASHPKVMTVLSGMTRMEDVVENVATLSPLRPLSEREFAALESAAVAFLGCGIVRCTNCNYCMPCPYGLDIPGLIAFRNEYLTRAGDRSPAEILAAYARAVPEPLRRADHCTGCGICRAHCPQMIPIPEEIAAIDRAVDALKDMEVRK